MKRTTPKLISFTLLTPMLAICLWQGVHILSGSVSQPDNNVVTLDPILVEPDLLLLDTRDESDLN